MEKKKQLLLNNIYYKMNKLIFVDKIITILKSSMLINHRYEYYQLLSVYFGILIMDDVIRSFNESTKDYNLVKTLDLKQSFLIS